jgi:hypothetical protein
VEAGPGRSTRDRLIGAAAVVMALGTLAVAVLNSRDVPWGELTASSKLMAMTILAIVGRVIQAGAFLCFAAAFRGAKRARDRRVGLGARVLLVAFAALFVASAYPLLTYGGEPLPLDIWAQLILQACAYVPWIAAAALVASAFVSRDPRGAGEDITARSRLLGWAGICAALGWALVLAMRFVGGWTWGWLGLGDWFEIADTAGFLGDVLSVVAPAFAVIGFFLFLLRAGWVQPSEPLLLRETWLVRAAGVLVLAGALAAVESAVSVWSNMSEGWDWGYGVFLWELLLDVRLTVAALLLVFAFAASRRALAGVSRSR